MNAGREGEGAPATAAQHFFLWAAVALKTRLLPAVAGQVGALAVFVAYLLSHPWYALVDSPDEAHFSLAGILAGDGVSLATNAAILAVLCAFVLGRASKAAFVICMLLLPWGAMDLVRTTISEGYLFREPQSNNGTLSPSNVYVFIGTVCSAVSVGVAVLVGAFARNGRPPRR